MIRAGVLGDPVSHSLSPILHGGWLKTYGIDGEYRAIHVLPEALEKTLKALADSGYAGCNLTIPHKEAALALVDKISPSAKAIGAINTLVFKDGQIIGDNTDGYGFIENLKSQIGDLTPHLDHCFIIGAGGAAKAIFYALKEAGAKRISITNRNRARAETYDAKIIDWEHKDDALSDVSLLVNTTSLGMQGQPALAISLDALPKTALVTDIVYQPLMTALINNAQARGNKTVTGIGMLIHQAVPGFEAWFGQKPDVTSEVYALLQNRLAS